MKKYKIFIGKKIPKEVEEYLSNYCELEKWEGKGHISRKELLTKLYDKDGLLLHGISVDEELLEYAPKLKAVSNISVGYNNFDIEAMKSRNIVGTNTPEVLDDTVADLIFGLILTTARRLSELDSYVKEGKWKPEDGENLFGVDVHHATLGIIGMGRIGEMVAKRAKLGFDMEVFYYNRNRKYETEESLGVKYCGMGELLKNSDFIVLMTPLNNDTYHLMDYEEFNLMKKDSIFINASRGQTVNEKALIEALETGKIRGAGLDVYDVEPINVDNPLLKMTNVVSLPHIGSATHKTRGNMAMMAAENLVKALSGEVPPNIVQELK